MFPIRDINPVAIKPWVKFVFIATCVGVFFGLQIHDTQREATEFLLRRAVISCEVTTGQPLSQVQFVNQDCAAPSQPPLYPEKDPFLAILTSMFLHGGLGHLLFNMWFLWIFGNNVEEAFGHFRFLFFYFAGGVAATLAFVAVNPVSTVPLVGASGAIAAVLGAYAVLYPTHRVITLLGWILVPIPAGLLLGIWFLLQFGLADGNIAWEAHVGGFVFGLLVALVFRRSLLARVG